MSSCVRWGVEDEYMSDLVKDLRTSNYVMERDGVKVYLAKVRDIVGKMAGTRFSPTL